MATNTNSFTGMFEDLGIDTRTQEQILAKRARDNEEKANTAPEGAEPFAGAHDLRRGGRILGNIIRKKFHKPQLSEQEQASVDAVAEAQTKFEEQRERGDFLDKAGKPDLLKESDGFNRAVAGSLLKIGDPRGMELAKRLDQDTRARAKDDQERVQGGLDIAESRRDEIKELYDFDRDVFLNNRGDFLPIYMKDSDDPNSGFGAHIQDDGSAVTTEGVTFEMNTYTTQRPIAPKLNKSGGAKPLKPQDFGWSSKAVSQVQARQRNLAGQFDMAVAMRDALADAVGADGTLNIMGTAGKIEKGIAALVGNIASLGRAAGKVLQIEDSDGNLSDFTGSSASAAKYVRENQDIFANMVLPASIIDDKNAIARYQAIIVQFAYGKARMNEENGRISDVDFNNAIKQIGAAATDPRELQNILVGDLGRASLDFDLWRAQMRDELVPLIFPPRSQVLFNKARDNFTAAFGVDFGLSGAVGEGLIDPQGESRSFTDTIQDSANSSPELDNLTLQLQKLEEENAARRQNN